MQPCYTHTQPWLLRSSTFVTYYTNLTKLIWILARFRNTVSAVSSIDPRSVRIGATRARVICPRNRAISAAPSYLCNRKCCPFRRSGFDALATRALTQRGTSKEIAKLRKPGQTARRGITFALVPQENIYNCLRRSLNSKLFLLLLRLDSFTRKSNGSEKER